MREPNLTQEELIFKTLKDNGIDVHMPAIKEDICRKPYVILKYAGSSKVAGLSTIQDWYTIMCYVPEDRYTDLNKYVKKVEDIMHTLQPEIVSTNQKTPSFYDQTVKAHMVSVQYRNYKKINGIINNT